MSENENAIVVSSADFEIEVASKYDDNIFDAINKSQVYLPRLQLMTKNSPICGSGEFPINHYARVYDSDNRDLGSTVDVFILAYRPMALETTTDGTVIVSYDPKPDANGELTGEFARIAAKADEGGMNGCMYGPQFLVWVPSTEEFMTLFLSSKTARRSAPSVKAMMMKAATLSSKEIKTKKYSWYGLVCTPCSTPFNMPSKDQVQSQINKFLNPEEPSVEVAEETNTGRE